MVDVTDSPRGIRAQSLAALCDALQGTRNGPISRVGVPTELFFQEQRTIRSGSQLSWAMDVGRQAAEKEMRKRLGQPHQIGEVKQQFDPLFDRSLASWAADLIRIT